MANLLIAGTGALIAYKVTEYLLEPAISLDGRVCLITGAGGGVGRQTALQFARAGCRLVLWDLSEQGLQGTVAAVNASVAGAQCFTMTVDISDASTVFEAAKVAASWAAPAHVSVLVNNAGIVAGKAFLETSVDGIQKTMQVNAMGHFWTCKAFLPAMIEHKQGHIVTVASAAGLSSAPMMVVYSSSKHAAVGFAHGLRKELKVLGHAELGTTLLCPGHITTDLFKGFKQPCMPSLSAQYVAEQILDGVLRNVPVKVLPALADPALMRAFFSTRLQDAIEFLSGMDGDMMGNTDMGHADRVLDKVSNRRVASKL